MAVAERARVRVPWATLPAGAPAAVPGFIFHIGHCGSTLLSRLLDLHEGVLALREPRVLRDLAAIDPSSGPLAESEWVDLIARSIGSLGRVLAPGQRIVIKATSSCNNLIAPIRAQFHTARMVLMRIALEPYLATMMKAQGGDALVHAPARLHFLRRRLGNDALPAAALDRGQLLAAGWLSELLRFSESDDSACVLELDFEELLADPERCLGRVADHLGVREGTSTVTRTAIAGVLRSYAKSPAHPYSRADRTHDLDLARRLFATDIGSGMRWAERMIAREASLMPLARYLR